ncbi:hypothetical protein Sgleb_02730 [Streptomyces glebosus]|uniref:Uncharacterized protein n=1 Tax=Streptomyces glebosus TaxID=249580 RepID=A0A640SQ53_9ACTN|nr:hypothetical protein Sgleb_02730 [Streptomyces glebosus]GHG72436.1 hypothetical protein GCM10010513_45260 [Streptomyces glebosus]
MRHGCPGGIVFPSDPPASVTPESADGALPIERVKASKPLCVLAGAFRTGRGEGVYSPADSAAVRGSNLSLVLRNIAAHASAPVPRSPRGRQWHKPPAPSPG